MDCKIDTSGANASQIWELCGYKGYVLSMYYIKTTVQIIFLFLFYFLSKVPSILCYWSRTLSPKEGGQQGTRWWHEPLSFAQRRLSVSLVICMITMITESSMNKESNLPNSLWTMRCSEGNIFHLPASRGALSPQLLSLQDLRNSSHRIFIAQSERAMSRAITLILPQ